MPVAATSFVKLRWPASLGFLFAGVKVAATLALVGAIVAELPTGAQAGLGARLLAGSYYGQTLQIWAALGDGRAVNAAGGRGRGRRATGARRTARRTAMIATTLISGCASLAVGTLVLIQLAGRDGRPFLVAAPVFFRRAAGLVLASGL